MKNILSIRGAHLAYYITFLVFVAAALTPGTIYAQAKPDLKVSAIATPGGLCAGEPGKVRVTVTNGSMAAVSQPIPVILFVSQPPNQPTSFVGSLPNGIGPNDNYGKPVWFNNVVAPSAGAVTLRAVVNPDQQIEESNYNNNSRIQNANVKDCSAPKPQGATLSITVYKPGTWQAGQYQAVSGANVQVACGSFNGSGVTGTNGKASIGSVPKGSCNIQVSKPGCPATVNRTYMMPTYNANVNIELDCP